MLENGKVNNMEISRMSYRIRSNGSLDFMNYTLYMIHKYYTCTYNKYFVVYVFIFVENLYFVYHHLDCTIIQKLIELQNLFTFTL